MRPLNRLNSGCENSPVPKSNQFFNVDAADQGGFFSISPQPKRIGSGLGLWEWG